LKPSVVDFEEYVCAVMLMSVCEVQSVDQILQDHQTCEDEEEQEEVEEELIKNKFLCSSRTRGGTKIHPAV
jgi:hypothetical protein